MLNTRTNRAPMTRSARCATVLALAGLAVAIAAAQGPFSTFSGSLVDPMNGTLPGATLVLTNTQTDAKYEIRSDSTGRFEFVGLPRGDYSLQVKLPGFATLQGTVTMTGQDVHRNLTLQVGSVQETITVIGGGGSRPRVVRAPMPARPIPPCVASSLGGNLRPPKKLVDVRPIYPTLVHDAGIGGSVGLESRISRDGIIDDVKVVKSVHPDLDASAVEAVRQWQFEPTLLNCAAVEVSMTVTVNFKTAAQP